MSFTRTTVPKMDLRFCCTMIAPPCLCAYSYPILCFSYLFIYFFARFALNPSPAQRRPTAPLHSLARHELVSAVCRGSCLSARYEAKGLNSPRPQTTKVSLFMIKRREVTQCRVFERKHGDDDKCSNNLR